MTIRLGHRNGLPDEERHCSQEKFPFCWSSNLFIRQKADEEVRVQRQLAETETAYRLLDSPILSLILLFNNIAGTQNLVITRE